MIKPYNLTVRRREDYSGEHREWDETIIIPAAEVARIMEAAIDDMGWPEIHAFQKELREGQDYREDAGGFFMRAIRALLGLKIKTDPVVSHADALHALLEEARKK